MAAAPPHGTMVSPHSAESAPIAFSTDGRTKTESGLDGVHVDAPADPHELLGADEPGQRLVDGRPASQVKQGAGANEARPQAGLRHAPECDSTGSA